MKYDLVSIGNRALKARTNKEIKQNEISEALGIHQATYSKFENGRYELSISKLFVLCEILEIKLSWLLGEEDEGLTARELHELDRYKKFILSKRI